MKYDKAKLATTNAQMKPALETLPLEIRKDLEKTVPLNATPDYLLGILDTISLLSALIRDYGRQQTFHIDLGAFLTLQGAIVSCKLAALEPTANTANPANTGSTLNVTA